MDKQKLIEIERHLNIPKSQVLTVSQISDYLVEKLEQDKTLSKVYLVGEISNLSKYNHIYFDLKDEKSSIGATIFEEYANNLEFELKNGMEVLVFGKVYLYPKTGKIKIKVYNVFPVGEGLQALRLKKLKEKLEKEGLFKQKHKKPIPLLPRVIGVITSSEGKAMKDITTSIQNRFQNVCLKIASAIVQGEKAPESIIRSIKILNKNEEVDVIVIARGGGSEEDLDCFNSENVVKAIFETNKPIITAIGHEHDWTIADYVSDFRAITPTDVAKNVIANKEEILRQLNYLEEDLTKAYQNRKTLKKQNKTIEKQKEAIVQQERKTNLYKWIAIAIGISLFIWTLIKILT